MYFSSGADILINAISIYYVCIYVCTVCMHVCIYVCIYVIYVLRKYDA